jgi:hypothetical protein
VQVTFRGAPDDVAVSIHAYGADGRLPYSLSGAAFEIIAQEQDSQIGVESFSEPITIAVSYDETQIRGSESTLTLFYFDEQMKSWRPLPTRVDTTQNRIFAQSDHLSSFDINPQDWEAARLPSMAAFQVSTYTGAASYSFPIQVPPGPAGLQPSLALSYNSQTVDSAGSRTQASWVGMGWSLDSGYIQRNQNGTPDYYEDDTFTLQANGVGGLLLPVPENEGGDGDSATIDYRLADEASGASANTRRQAMLVDIMAIDRIG